jgi:glycosyltransferase involved in cell wall biosynthesis
MKILIINYEFPPLGGGGGSFSKDLALELVKHNEVDVVTTHYGGLPKQERSGGIGIYRVPVLNRRSLYEASLFSLLSFPLSAVIKSLSLARRKKYDLINTHFAIPTGPAGLIVSSLTGIPNVVSVHGSDIYNPASRYSPHNNTALKYTVKKVLSKADRVLAQSSDMKNYINELYSRKNNIQIIPLALPDSEINSLLAFSSSVNEKGAKLVSVGRMAKVKGYDFLIRALALISKKIPETELTLIGDGPERHCLEALVSELGLRNRVTFTGWLTGSEKYKKLRASDIYVMSSLHEGFGVVLLEAMACGLPIVCTDSGGQVDIIKNGVNGFLAKSADEHDLAGKILALAENKKKRAALSANNREEINNYRISSTAKKYLEVFNEAIDMKNKNSGE